MSSKFTECTLGQMYRVERPDGSISGGPMHYLDVGLKELGIGRFGKLLAVVFALMCIGGSFGGGNMFQANQSYAAIQDVVPLLEGRAWLYGLIMAFLVALVIIGGIRRIGTATSLIVPIMCGIYVLAGLWILVVNAEEVPQALGTIFREAFTPSAAYGGFIGTLVQGFRRAAFSNEAGVGSASIAHSAASTKYGVREGIVALLEPFIDTIVVCTMTGLVVVVTGAYLDVGEGTFSQGVVMTDPVRLLHHDLVELLRRAVRDLAVRRPGHRALPHHFPVLCVLRGGVQAGPRARLLRPHDPRDGLPQHVRRGAPLRKGQAGAGRLLGPAQGRGVQGEAAAEGGVGSATFAAGTRVPTSRTTAITRTIPTRMRSQGFTPNPAGR